MFKIGDTVWCVAYGKGRVVGMDIGSTPYPVKVELDNGKLLSWYTQDGKLFEDSNRTLFFSEPKIEAREDRPFEPTLHTGDRIVISLSSEEDHDFLVFTVEKETPKEVIAATSGACYRKEFFKFYKLVELELK